MTDLSVTQGIRGAVQSAENRAAEAMLTSTNAMTMARHSALQMLREELDNLIEDMKVNWI